MRTPRLGGEQPTPSGRSRRAVLPVLLDRPLTPAEAAWVAAWRYPPPFDLYNGSPDAGNVMCVREPDGSGYYALGWREDGAPSHHLVGFICLGSEARVTGQAHVPGVIDVGAGLAPEAVSQGIMTRVLPQVLRFIARRFPEAGSARVAVAEFNERSLRVCRRAGFEDESRLVSPKGQVFLQLRRSLRPL